MTTLDQARAELALAVENFLDTLEASPARHLPGVKSRVDRWRALTRAELEATHGEALAASSFIAPACRERRQPTA